LAQISNPHPALRADLSQRERGRSAAQIGCGFAAHFDSCLEAKIVASCPIKRYISSSNKGFKKQKQVQPGVSLLDA
jgi:hypothetical protein